MVDTQTDNPFPDQHCEHCLFYIKVVRECRRYPPMTVLNPNAKTETDQLSTRWPTVELTDWCGEFAEPPAPPPDSPAG